MTSPGSPAVVEIWSVSTIANSPYAVSPEVGQMSTLLAGANLNMADLLNKSRGELAYSLIDVEGAVPERSSTGSAPSTGY